MPAPASGYKFFWLHTAMMMAVRPGTTCWFRWWTTATRGSFLLRRIPRYECCKIRINEITLVHARPASTVACVLCGMIGVGKLIELICGNPIAVMDRVDTFRVAFSYLDKRVAVAGSRISKTCTVDSSGHVQSTEV